MKSGHLKVKTFSFLSFQYGSKSYYISYMEGSRNTLRDPYEMGSNFGNPDWPLLTMTMTMVDNSIFSFRRGEKFQLPRCCSGIQNPADPDST
jgi:hypothetical protein